jgi:hypothetical protein
MADLFPTAHQVALAIVAACRETGADPLKIEYVGDQARGRARLYAAVALRELFSSPDPGAPGNVSFSRMCGGNKNMLTLFDNQQRRGGNPWWDYYALERVRAAVGHVDKPKATATVLPISAAARTAVASFSCQNCGKPCSVGSKECRDCFRGLTRRPQPAPDKPPPYVPRVQRRESPDDARVPESVAPGKKKLYDMLAEAAANTARLQNGGGE